LTCFPVESSAWIWRLFGTKSTLWTADGLSLTSWINAPYVIFWVSLELPGRRVREARKTKRTMTISGKSALRKKRFKRDPLVR
jgi:hypothetical protein